MLLRLIYFLTGTVFLTGYAPAQNPSDSALLQQAVSRSVQQYFGLFGENIHLYNGTEYIRYNTGAKGHPFFLSEQPVKSDIVYGGILYRDVNLSYDLTSEEILAILPVQNVNLKLVNKKIESFNLSNHHFIRIDSTSGNLSSGFYEILHQHKNVMLLAKRLKRVVQSPRPEEPPRFLQQDIYFISTGSDYYNISSKKSIINILKDKKEEIRRFIKENKLNFKKDAENTIIKTTMQYARLKE
ncbi:MAG: hypothetical protein SFU87_06835 [Chitinophagaceae bacterium]|nr:hypothetical protein [Chitinophagaceae bacterium]